MSMFVPHIVRIAGLGVLLIATAGSAQPGTPQPGGEPPAGAQPGEPGRGGRRVEQPVDRATLRSRLERRLEESRKSAAWLESAIQKLDSGADPMEVSRQFDRPGRGRGGEGGRGGGDGGGRGGNRPEGFGPGDNSPVSPAERDALMAMLKDTMPTVAERLENLAKADPSSSERLLNRLLPRLRDAASVRERDPELFELKLNELRTSSDLMAAAQAVREYQGDEAGKQKLREALKEAVAKQFDARQASQDREIKQLEERLAELKAEAAEKAASREEMIEGFAKKLEEMRPPGGGHGEGRPPK